MKAKELEGLVLPNDITRYELQLKSLELSLVKLKNTKEIINNNMVSVLGLDDNDYIVIDTDILREEISIYDEIYWQNDAINKSPNLRIADKSIELSKEHKRLVNSERIPSIALFAGDSFDGPILIEVPTINKNLNYWYIGIGIKYNIASLYKSSRKINQANLSINRNKEERALLEEYIKTEVKGTYIRFNEAYTILDTQEKSLELASQNYNVVNNRYLNDLATLPDMLDAANSKLNSELQVVNARINILFNYFKLKKVTGNL